MNASAITDIEQSAKPIPVLKCTGQDPNMDIANNYFQTAYGLTLDNLLLPIEDELSQTGENLRGHSTFRHIEEARKSDDTSLPMGPWERELKYADWPLVGKLSVQCLTQRSKDLQLAAWILESGLHCYGLVALAPGLTLLRTLSERYWDSIYPGNAAEDLDYRINLFRWIDDKFPKLLALMPLTEAGFEDGELSLGDWRRANFPDEDGRHDPIKQEAFLAVLAGTSTHLLVVQDQQLRASRDAIDALDHSLDRLCGTESPGFSGFKSILNEIEGLVGMELEQRGQTDDMQDIAEPDQEHLANATDETLTPSTGGIARRQEAYAMLVRAADCLMQTDPHSPVPYLIRQAIAWGQMDTRALYQELFLNQGGQINVFHLLGLDTEGNTSIGNGNSDV
jgi:type VI secretion system protein ImpA